jgi:hypothetical protein
MTEPPNPAVIVLTSLKEMCEQVRRNNRDPEVAREALEWELKFSAGLGKIAGGTEREPVKAA